MLRVNSLLGSHATRCNFGYVTSGAYSSETVGSTDLWLVPMAPAQKNTFLMQGVYAVLIVLIFGQMSLFVLIFDNCPYLSLFFDKSPSFVLIFNNLA